MNIKKMMALPVIVSLSTVLAACGNGASGSTGQNDTEQVTIKVWSWEPTVKKAVADFEKEHPNIKVDVDNVGSSNDEYQALSNAIAAGKGAPDLVQFDFNAIPQFAMTDGLVALDDLGAKDVIGQFTKGATSGVTVNDKIYGMPIGGGPMALFYNKAIFDQAGVSEAPKTWDEYYEAAKKIHALGSDYYITAESGTDAGVALSLIWQHGGTPFKIKGNRITINLTSDQATQDYATYWQRMIDEGLIDTKTVGWSDDWFRGLGTGRIASLPIGGWMPITLKTSAAEASGNFRVAALPAWKAGDTSSAENGGGALSVVKGSAHAQAAYEFAKYVAVGGGHQTLVDNGIVPDVTTTLKSKEYLDKTDDYFGGQKVNEVIAASAANVKTNFQYLPYQVYAGDIYSDYVGKAFSGGSRTTIAEGLAAWQKALVTYGKQQGFDVVEG